MKRKMLAMFTFALILSVSFAMAEGKAMFDIDVNVGNETFTAKLYDTETARALLEMLPLQLEMRELNANEKYGDLPQNLPANSSGPGRIRSGDIMLYGSNCLVLFYQSFSTDYHYTQLGYIEHPEGLADALGSDGVRVTLALQ